MRSEDRRYRSRIRIYHDILVVIKGNPMAKITHLIHMVNLPHDRLIEYLTQMESDGLVERANEGVNQRYKVTHKGERFVKEFRSMRDWANAFGIDL